MFPPVRLKTKLFRPEGNDARPDNFDKEVEFAWGIDKLSGMDREDWGVPLQQRVSARLGCRRRRPMTKRQDRDAIYVKRQFDTEIIVLCVRWYITYRLSYRDLVAMMAERGVIISHTTIMRWVIRYVPEFAKRWNRFARSIGSSWRVDETYISIKGQ
jgi:hypothetical protein